MSHQLPTRPQRRQRNEYEQRLLDSAAKLLPAAALTPSMSLADAMVIKEGRGSKVVDMSGNEYIDYLLGSGPMLLGHAHPAVVAAVRGCLERGSSYLLPNEPSILLAEALVDAIPCAERLCYCSTGSDSTFFALRLARAYRKRDKILKFEGGYHGQGDHVLMSNQWTREPAAFPAPVPNSVGLPKSAENEVLVARRRPESSRSTETSSRASSSSPCNARFRPRRGSFRSCARSRPGAKFR
jgi:glutamate-1-semialdehyde 2,1-aminomutase